MVTIAFYHPVDYYFYKKEYELVLSQPTENIREKHGNGLISSDEKCGIDYFHWKKASPRTFISCLVSSWIIRMTDIR